MRSCAVAVVLGILALPGCGGDGLKRVHATGQLTVDGKPLEGVLVRLVPADTTPGAGAHGFTRSDGSFDLADSRGTRGGVVVGAYRVALSRMVMPDGSPLPRGSSEVDHPTAKNWFPRRLNSVTDTPLKCTVSESGGVIAIDVPASLLAKK